MRTTSSGTSESSTASAQTRPSERSWYFPDVLVINSTQQRLALLRCTTRSLRRAHSRSAISPSAITCGSVVPVHSPRSHTVDLWPTSRFTGDQGHIEMPLDSIQAGVDEAESKNCIAACKSRATILCLRLSPNWIEHLTTDQEVGGSSPSKRAEQIPRHWRGIFWF